MSATQRLHGEYADAVGPRGGDGVLHVLPGPVLDADATHVDQRVDDVDHVETGRGPDAAAEVGADAHRADVPHFPLPGQVDEGFLVAPQRVKRFLLVEHEEVDVIPTHPHEGPLQRSLGRRLVVAVGLGADHVVRRVLQRQADVGIGAVKVGGIQEAHTPLVGVDQQVGPFPRGQVAL